MKVERFRKGLLGWYEEYRRDLPWRDVHSPYHIWISEIILQQTRISQGTAYYLNFIRQFPDVVSLARASEDQVLKVWEGLGYYSRARNLHYTAQTIVNEYGGLFPTTYEKLKKLKGVGEYTAAAIGSMAFGLPIAAVDGNAYRLLSRVYGIGTPIDTSQGKKRFRELAQILLDVDRPADFNQAIMDFGSLQCIPQNPLCEKCPFKIECEAYKLGKVSMYPIKSHKMEQKHRYFNYIIVEYHNEILIHRRKDGDIWQGLYEPYLVETKGDTELESMTDALIDNLMAFKGNSMKLLCGPLIHTLTHRVIHARFYGLMVETLPEGIFFPEGYFFVAKENFAEYAFPALFVKCGLESY